MLVYSCNDSYLAVKSKCNKMDVSQNHIEEKMKDT